MGFQRGFQPLQVVGQGLQRPQHQGGRHNIVPGGFDGGVKGGHARIQPQIGQKHRLPTLQAGAGGFHHSRRLVDGAEDGREGGLGHGVPSFG